MPVLGGNSSAGFSFTTTAQQIVSASSQDIRQFLASTGTDANVLLDYVNRIHLDILRRSRWPYSMSTSQFFVTLPQQTDYWVGPTGTGPTTAVDTGLNLSDVFRIVPHSAYDRSNYRELRTGTVSSPLGLMIAFRTGLGRPGLPAVMMQDVTTPNLLNIWPPPNNENVESPIPETPIVTTGAGGSLAQRVEYFACTFIDSLGNEGAPSTVYKKQEVLANNLATVLSPYMKSTQTDSGVTYVSYNVYATTVAGAIGTLQNVSPINLGTNWTEPTSGLTTTGVQPPTGAALTTMGGYLIEFRYFKARPQITALGTVLAIPDDYKDVVINGVNMLAFKLAERLDDAQLYKQLYEQGVAQIVADKNLFPSGDNFIKPDPASITYPSGGSIGIVEIFNS